MEYTELYNISISSAISVVITLLIHFVLFYVIFPQDEGSRSKYYGRLYWLSRNLYDSENTPQKRVLEMSERWGSPSSIDRNIGGTALWKADDIRTSQFVRAEIVDEMVHHMKPYPHYDFFTVWYPLGVSDEKAENLYKISETVMYDHLKKQIIVRSDGLESIVVILWIVKKYVAGDYSLEEAMEEISPRIKEIRKHKVDSKQYDLYYHDL